MMVDASDKEVKDGKKEKDGRRMRVGVGVVKQKPTSFDLYSFISLNKKIT